MQDGKRGGEMGGGRRKSKQSVSNEGEKNGGVNESGTSGEESLYPVKLMSRTDKNIVRIIGQHLQNLGLTRTADQLVLESGCMFEHPAASGFRHNILSGDWNKALSALKDLESLIEEPDANIKMRFLVLEQKYLELLEDGRVVEAIQCLRSELTPINYNTDRVHELSFLVVCESPSELHKMAGDWHGKSRFSRTRLIEKLQVYMPACVMLPPQRLVTLLGQAVELQQERCMYHNTSLTPLTTREDGSITLHDSMSILNDHVCDKETFPCDTVQVLIDHLDEVWFCRFSPDGRSLATGSKDGSLIIWSIDLITHKAELEHTLDGHLSGVGYISWSPDGNYIIGCGTEDCADLWIWYAKTGELKVKMSHAAEDSLTCASWFKNSQKFVVAGTRGQFYLCDVEGSLLHSWEGVRVQCLACLDDNKTVLAADTHKRLRSYNFDDLTDQTLLREDHSIMSVTLNESCRLALLNVASQGVHLWDIKDRCLLRKFQGITQGLYTIHSCFGGVNGDYIGSGSEDSKIHIWHRRREMPVTVLEGHSRTVNCVDWNPVLPSMLVSVSDDFTVRLWGPRTIPDNNHTTTTASASNGLTPHIQANGRISTVNSLDQLE